MPNTNDAATQIDGLSRYLDQIDTPKPQGAGARSSAAGGLSGYLDYLDAQPEPEAPKKAPERTYLEATNDFIIDTANSAAGLVKAGADLVSPESSVSKFIDENIIKDGQAKQSDRKKFYRQELATQLAEAGKNDGTTSGELGAEARKFGTQMAHAFTTDPLGTAGEILGNLGPFAILGKGMQAAKMAAGVRTAIASGVAGGMSAGEVRGNIWERINSMPDADLTASSPAYADLRKRGMTEAQAKSEMGANLSRNLPEVAIAGLIGALSGKYGVEGMAAGTFPKMGRVGAAVVGGIDEGFVQGGSEQVASNYGVQRVKPDQSLLQDVGQNIAAEGLPGVAMGVISGGRGPVPPPSPVVAKAAEPNSPLSRAALAGRPDLAAPAVPAVPAGNAGNADPITQRATEIETAVRDGQLLEKLRATGQPTADLLGALAAAKNPGVEPRLRQKALDDLERGLRAAQVQGAKQAGQAWQDLGITQPADDLATQEAANQSANAAGQAWQDLGITQPVDELQQQRGEATAQRLTEAGRQWQDIKPIGTPAWESSALPAADAKPEPITQPQEQAHGPEATQAVEATQEGSPAPATQQPVAEPPAARRQVEAPKVATPRETDANRGTAQVRQRKAQLAAMAADGFDTVERRPDGFWLVNTRRGEESHLATPGDAQMARKAITDYIDGASHQGAASPKNDLAPPTDGQIEAENYKKGHLQINGMDVSVENPRGSTRSGTAPDGKKWSQTMAHHYGYFKRTEGADGDALDVFIGTRPDTDRVFVVDQLNQDGSFDEHKVMMGFLDEAAARQGYLANYEKGWTGLGAITPMTTAQFKAWAKSDLAKEPASLYAQQQTTGAQDDGRGSAETGVANDPGLRGSEAERGTGLGGAQDQPAPEGTRPAGSQGAAAQQAGDSDAGAQSAVARIGRQLKAPVELAQGEEAGALNVLLGVFAQLTGKRGYAVTGSAVGDGVTNGVDFFVNVENPHMHVAWTIGHEFKHLSERFPGLKALYERIWSLIDSEQGKREYFEYLKRSSASDITESYEQITPEHAELLKSEMLADFMGKRFNDKPWLEQLAKQKPKLFGDFVRDWLDVLSQLISALRGRPDKMSGVKNIDQYISRLEDAKAIAMEVAMAWAERNPKMAQSTGVAGAIQYNTQDAYDFDVAGMDAYLDSELQAQLQAELQAADANAEEAGGPLGEVTDADIEAQGIMAEEAYGPLHWEDKSGEGVVFTAEIPDLYEKGKVGKVYLEGEEDDTWGATLRQTWLGPTENEDEGYVSREAAEQFVQRFVASKDLARRGFDLADSITPEQTERLLKAWASFNALDGVRRYESVDDGVTGLKDIAAAMGLTSGYDIKFHKEATGPGSEILSVGFVNKANGDAQDATLEIHRVDGKKVGTAHTSSLRRGGLGAAFYQLMSEYAAVHDIRIAPDHSLSGINTYRRTEQQLSAALRTGNSTVMVPHPTQRVYGFDSNAKTKSEHAANVARLLLAGLRNAREIVPEVEGLDYDPETGEFLDFLGDNANDAAQEILGRHDVRAFGFGRSTLARAAMTRMILDDTLSANGVKSFHRPVLYSAREGAQAEYAAVEARYRDTPQWLKAPNGEQTKLTKRQWVQVRTPMFKAWFGDWEKFAGTRAGVWEDNKGEVSKVVDDNGEPMVVYHGTDSGGFMAFKRPAGDKRGNLGIFTTSNLDMARSYVRKGRAQDLTPKTIETRDQLEEAGVTFEASEVEVSLAGQADATELKHYWYDGYEHGPFESEADALADALQNFEPEMEKKAGIYAAFVNLRNPSEEDFEGALWNGSRDHQWIVEVAGENQVDADGRQYFDNLEEAKAFAATFASQEDRDYVRDEAWGDVDQPPSTDDYVRAADDHHFGTDDAVREAKSGKHDGAILRQVVDDGGGPGYEDMAPSDVFVAFDPAQIKSADWNTGEFGDTDDLRYSTKDDAKPRQRGVIGEVVPHPEQAVAHEWDAMTDAEKQVASRSVAGKIAQRVFDEMGLKGWSADFSTGSWNGKVNPNFILTAPQDASQVQIDEVAMVLGYVFDQQAIVAFDDSNTQSAKMAGFVKVMLPEGMPQSKVAELRKWIGQHAPRAGSDTLRGGALVFGNFTAFDEGQPELSDAEYEKQIFDAVGLFEPENWDIEVRDIRRSHSELIWPDGRNEYLKGTRYDGTHDEVETRGDNLRDGQGRNLVSAIERIAADATRLRKQWIDASAAGLQRAERRRAGAAQAGAAAVEYGHPTTGAVSAVGVHFSQAPRALLSSQYFGTGLKGLERERLGNPANADIRPRLNFYVDNGSGVHPEAGVGAARHVVRLKNLYDTKADPLGLVKNNRGPSEAARASSLERAVMQAGFDGYLADTGANQNFAVLIGKHDVSMGEVQHSVRELGYYSELSAQIEKAAMKQAPSGAWKSYIKALSQKGVKADEVEWTGVNDFLDLQTGKVSKEALLGYLDANGVAVQEVVLGDESADQALERWLNTKAMERYGSSFNGLSEDDQDYLRGKADDANISTESPTKYGQYTLPGATNYREVLLTLPGMSNDERLKQWRKKYPEWKEGQHYSMVMSEADQVKFKAEVDGTKSDYRSSHWDQPNVLAHIRVNDRVDADGGRVLFVEEIQSDFGQETKKKGAAGTIEAALKANGMTRAEFDALPKDDQAFTINETRNMGLPPAAPFVGRTDAWVALALKRVIKMAVGGGYDKVAFISGQQSTDRYWNEPIIVGAVGRWNEVTKPESIGELSENVLGRKMAALMPLNHVDAGMLPMLKNNQVLKDVVSRVPVDVVNMLAEHSVSAEQLLRNGDVVLDGLPVDDRSRAATAIGSAIGESSAAIRAKLRGLSSGGSDIKILPTLSASDLSPRDVAGVLDPHRLFHGGSSDQAKGATSAGAIAKPASSVKGGRVEVQGGTAELTEFLNAHAEIIHGREGLLQQGFEAPPSEGMKAFYDTIVPNATKALLKKLGGGQMEAVKLPAERTRDADGIPSTRENFTQQPGFEVTQALRAKVGDGLPLFSKRDAELIEAKARLAPVDPETPKARKFAGKKVVVPVKIEDTGEVASLTMDVNQTLDDYDERTANMQKLLECLT